jgi:hypothetical protein
MKKIKSKKLDFKKTNVVELDSKQMYTIWGGTEDNGSYNAHTIIIVLPSLPATDPNSIWTSEYCSKL